MTPKWDIVPLNQAPPSSTVTPTASLDEPHNTPGDALVPVSARVQSSEKHTTQRPVPAAGNGKLSADVGWFTLPNTNVFTELPPGEALDFQLSTYNGMLLGGEAYSGGAIDTDNDRLILMGRRRGRTMRQ